MARATSQPFFAMRMNEIARAVELADQVSRDLDQGRGEGRRADARRTIRPLADTQAAEPEPPAAFRPKRATWATWAGVSWN
jgi:hypothetical protein